MVNVTAIFTSRADAEQASRQLASLGIPKDKIVTLTPQLNEKELARVQTTQGEQPGMVVALGALAGGAVGAGIAEALAAALLPGVGPILAIGLAGGALIGALAGGSAGKLAEDSAFSALPEEELFFYEDAVRQGRTVVLAMAENERQSQVVRGIFEEAEAESIDEARKRWWLGIRDVEKEHYHPGEGSFESNEPDFRAGFEAALRPNRPGAGQSGEKAAEERAQRDPHFRRKVFEDGYRRGLAYRQARFEERRKAPW